ncbi:MAG: hypothetical protein M1832_005209 [Thelocarpon impressellum]|nr:MAG: hypothetical protein M1832_005209 [Thelocarpon impressellum]
MVASSIVTAFLGAFQASIAVLLTIGYGVIAAQFRILEEGPARDISKLCVRMFLPALLVTNVGSQLHLDTAARYGPVLVWSLIYTLVSMAVGLAATRVFKFPAWVTPAIAFNNTTSLPLLLIQSLNATGVLSKLLMDGSDSTSAAVQRAESYFLVCAIVGNCLTFSLGPKLLDGEEAPDKEKEEEQQRDESEHDGGNDDGPHDVETGGPRPEGQDGEAADENTSLLPDPVIEHGTRAWKKTARESRKYWDKLPLWLQLTLDFLYAFLNAPLIGAVVGAILGLVPPLHRIFFSSTEDGGYFKAWLTTSVQNIGDLFAALQLVVVGSKLSNSLRKMKKGEESGRVPWTPMIFVFAMRFVFWPLVSIPLIWALASRTKLLGDDPMLWFCMALMAGGPSAIKLTALADVNGSNEQEKMSIAKFLTVSCSRRAPFGGGPRTHTNPAHQISYAVSPVICFAVAGALKASEAAMTERAQ